MMLPLVSMYLLKEEAAVAYKMKKRRTRPAISSRPIWYATGVHVSDQVLKKKVQSIEPSAFGIACVQYQKTPPRMPNTIAGTESPQTIRSSPMRMAG